MELQLILSLSIKFITLFILVISSLEVLHSLTFLGTFDIMDIISNTLGSIIGVVTYKIGFSSEITFKKIVLSLTELVNERSCSLE